MSQLGTGRDPVTPTMLIWGDPVNDASFNQGSIVLGGNGNVVVSEDHERTAMVTEHSVEQGSPVVDHIRPNPQTLKLDVFISNTPVKSSDGEFLPITIELDTPGDKSASFLSQITAGGTGGLIQKGLNAIGIGKGPPTKITPVLLQFNDDTDYVQIALNAFTDLLDNGVLVQIFTPRANYQNMVLSSVVMHRDKGTGTSANFTLNFKQIRFVSSKIVDAPLPSIVRATPNNNLGKKDTKQASTQDESVGHRNQAATGNVFIPGAGANPLTGQ